MSAHDAMAALQGELVGNWRADAALTALIGEGGVFDAPPRGARAPYVTILRHDAVPRDGDLAPGLEHRLTVHCWSAQPSRKAALAIAARIEAGALEMPLAPFGHRVSLRRHLRTETAVDLSTGRARAAVMLRLFTEPND